MDSDVRPAWREWYHFYAECNGRIYKMQLHWQTIVRLVAVQLAHRAISALSRGIREGVQAAIELEKKIAEVRTLSQEAQLPFEAWRDSLKSLSDEFGISIVNQTEAAYRRGDLFAKRQKLMDSWANFVTSSKTGSVVPISKLKLDVR